MLLLQCPAILTADDNCSYLVTFPDFDDAVTFGETREQALEHAIHALQTVILSRMKAKIDLPKPSEQKHRAMVAIPPLTAAKALL